jgi:Cof subfamily protein (haloacid dehalogenase superfamily)
LALSLLEFKKRLKKVKFLVTDVDGTLTDDRENVSERTKNLIFELQKKGVTVSVATQKIFSSVKDLMKNLNLDTYFISANGRYISDLNGNVLAESYIKRRFLMKAIELSKKMRVRIALCNNNEIVYTKENSAITTLPHRLGTNYRLVENYSDYQEKVVEIIFISYERKVIRYIQKKMTFPMKMFLDAHYFRISSQSSYYNLDVREARVDKCSALKILAKYYKVKKNEVAVIGDWYNDMDLFRFGGLNVALKNAVPRLRYLADYVVNKTNNEDGVGDFLQLLLEVNNN